MLFPPPGETNDQGSQYHLLILTMRKIRTKMSKNLTMMIKDLMETIKTLMTPESS